MPSAVSDATAPRTGVPALGELISPAALALVRPLLPRLANLYYRFQIAKSSALIGVCFLTCWHPSM